MLGSYEQIQEMGLDIEAILSDYQNTKQKTTDVVFKKE